MAHRSKPLGGGPAADSQGRLPGGEGSDRRPNVVIVLADDMGWGDLGCYGATAIPTPNIDRLARDGMRFTDAHASSAVCSPSRYSLLTGEYAWRGPLKRGVLGGHGPPLLRDGQSTLATVLQGSGYATAAIGKWHLGLRWRWRSGRRLDAFGPNPVFWPPTEVDQGSDVDYSQPFVGGPTEHGFERFFGIAGSLDMPPYCFLDQDRPLEIPTLGKVTYLPSQRPGLQTPGWRDDEVDMRFTAEAVRWVRQRPADGKPFMLYLAPAAPHRPCVPPDWIQGSSDAGPRGDAVCLVDWMVGELLAAVDEIGEAENTLFIVTSDNGAPTCFPEDGDVVRHRPNGPWRGQKADIWEGGHRIPLVVRWPGRVAAGSQWTEPVCLTDLLRTVGTVAGATVAPEIAGDSIDLTQAITGHSASTGVRRLALVHHSNTGIFALREGRWKAAFGSGSGGFSRPTGDPWSPQHPEGQLYDIESGPTEDRNLWAERPDVVGALASRLAAIAGSEPSLPFTDADARRLLGISEGRS